RAEGGEGVVKPLRRPLSACASNPTVVPRSPDRGTWLDRRFAGVGKDKEAFSWGTWAVTAYFDFGEGLSFCASAQRIYARGLASFSVMIESMVAFLWRVMDFPATMRELMI